MRERMPPIQEPSAKLKAQTVALSKLPPPTLEEVHAQVEATNKIRAKILASKMRK